MLSKYIHYFENIEDIEKNWNLNINQGPKVFSKVRENFMC